MNRILVTPRSLTKEGHPSLRRLSDAGYEVVLSSPGVQPTEEELIKLLDGCIGMLAGVEQITARVLKAATTLKVISRNGVGVSNIDLKTAQERGIKVLVTAGTNAQGVAELTFGLLLALARSIPFSDFSLKQRRWDRREGFELENKTLGVIGCGRIGKRVASIASAFGMMVCAFDPAPDASFQLGPHFRYVTLDELLASS
ncbi:MAG TPA: NAD(P)-dependent oxidoreductase, partial [Verrucomicrobiota bacterium]|nr:NAD(P)-dependent oxidoreductase [Verrucomicrobiota bacterium]